MSGPLLDRIDIQCGVAAVKPEDLESLKPGESSASIRERVVAARAVQAERYRGMKGVITNADAKSRDLKDICRLTDKAAALMHDKLSMLGLSARSYDRILRVARTFADIAERADVTFEDVYNATRYHGREGGADAFWA